MQTHPNHAPADLEPNRTTSGTRPALDFDPALTEKANYDSVTFMPSPGVPNQDQANTAPLSAAERLRELKGSPRNGNNNNFGQQAAEAFPGSFPIADFTTPGFTTPMDFATPNVTTTPVQSIPNYRQNPPSIPPMPTYPDPANSQTNFSLNSNVSITQPNRPVMSQPLPNPTHRPAYPTNNPPTWPQNNPNTPNNYIPAPKNNPDAQPHTPETIYSIPIQPPVPQSQINTPVTPPPPQIPVKNQDITPPDAKTKPIGSEPSEQQPEHLKKLRQMLGGQNNIIPWGKKQTASQPDKVQEMLQAMRSAK